MKNQNRKVYVAGRIEPRENTHVISKNYQYFDFNLPCNHMKAATRIIFQVSELQLTHQNDLQC